ncbi:MAG: sigma-70 family RNA polymerase sigma factor [candidate division Zixibacteria bacterium]
MNQNHKNAIQRDEQELIRLAQFGDFGAFNALIKEYQSKIYGLALKLSKNREDAEDIFQETFLKAIDNIKRFRGESVFGTWLYAIAVNVVRAKYGKESKADLLSIEEYLPAQKSHHNEDIPELFDWNDPLSKMTDLEIKEKIENGLRELPLKYRIPFLLRYTQELSLQEVADTLNLSLAAAKSRVLRARLAMRQYLNDYFMEELKHG